MFAALLILSPAIAAAATTYTLTVSTNANTYNDHLPITITGAVAPAPGAGTEVSLFITNPQGTLTYTTATSVDGTSGSYTAIVSAAYVGVGTNWITGSYTVTATWALTATSTPVTQVAHFTYSASGTVVVSGASISVGVTTGGPFYTGQSFDVYALVQWNNGSLASVSNFPTAQVSAGTALTNLGTPTMVHKGFYFWTVSTSGLANGVYGVQIEANASHVIAQGLGAFTINNAIANGNSIGKSLAGNFSALNDAVTSIKNTLGSVSNGVTGLTGTLQTMSTQIGTLSGLSGQMTTLSGKVTDATNAVNSTQTYVLVVAVLAAITLVLELAVLIRKLS
jgi:hypothetical protein